MALFTWYKAYLDIDNPSICVLFSWLASFPYSLQEKLTNMELENQVLRQQALFRSPVRTIPENTSPKAVSAFSILVLPPLSYTHDSLRPVQISVFWSFLFFHSSIFLVFLPSLYWVPSLAFHLCRIQLMAVHTGMNRWLEVVVL